MRLICSAALLVLVAGCHDSPAPPATIDGQYPLRTYRDYALPAVVSQDANHSVQMVSGTITLNGDLTFEATYNYKNYDYGVSSTVVATCTGRWTPTGMSAQGGQLVGVYENIGTTCGDRATGEWDGRNTLTLAWNSRGLMQYRRGPGWTL